MTYCAPLTITSEQVTRFWSKVHRTDACWLWRGSITKLGYGTVGVSGKRYLAHRLSYMLTIGPTADGLVIDHLCRVRNCVNPEHLEEVTQRENLLRGDTIIARQIAEADAKTHCARGHELTEDNTRLRSRPGRSTTRTCLICDRARRHREYLSAKLKGTRSAA